MLTRKAALPGLKVSTTILMLVLLVLNNIPAAPATATPVSTSPTGLVTNAGAPNSSSAMSNMPQSMPGMDMSGQDDAMLPGQYNLSAVTLNVPEVTIDVSNFTFTPVTQTVTVGTTVHWNWVGGFHSVVSDTGLFSSVPPTTTTGVNFSYTFTQPGTYYYHCSVHGTAGDGSHLGVGMSGVIVVVAPVPTVTGLSPDTNMAGNPNFDLTVKGSNFTAASTLKFGVHSETVTFINSSTLLARIPAADFTTVAMVPVVVTEGGQDTAPVNFEVTSTCTARVVTKKTGGTACGEFRNALANSTGISFALLQNDTISLGSPVLTWPNSTETLTGICGTGGPALKVDVSALTGGFQVKGGAVINGLEILSSGTNGLPVLSLTAPTGPNTFICSKITRV